MDDNFIGLVLEYNLTPDTPACCTQTRSTIGIYDYVSESFNLFRVWQKLNLPVDSKKLVPIMRLRCLGKTREKGQNEAVVNSVTNWFLKKKFK